MNPKGWIGVDLDGTLAEYDYWRGINHIGEPIPVMVEYVKDLLELGVEVRIFTARLQEPDALVFIQAWCKKVFGTILPVTDKKDFSMVWMIDDRSSNPMDDDWEESPIILAQLASRHWDSPKAPPKEMAK